MKIYTEAVRFKADQKLLDYVERKLRKMEVFYEHILNARVVLKLENSGQVKDKVVEVRLNVPGETIIAKAVSKTFEASVDETQELLKRQIERYKDRLRA